MKKQKIFIFSLFAAVAFILSGCSGVKNETSQQGNQPPINENINNQLNLPKQPEVSKKETKMDEFEKEAEEIYASLNSLQNNELSEESLADTELGL